MSSEQLEPTVAVVDADGVALNVIHATPEVAAELAELGAFPGAAGLRDVTQADPRPGPGWRYQRATKTWAEPEENQQ